MKTILRGALVALLATGCAHERRGPAHVPALDGADRVPPRVGFAIVKTASLRVREGLVFAGGDFSAEVENDFSAFLVKHDDTYLLFDSGLGRDVKRQYAEDMPLWQRPFFRYDAPVTPARDQLDAAGIAVSRIVLSHAHWDHASGLVDFPGVPVALAARERTFVEHAAGGVGGAWPSQVRGRDIAWETLALADVPFEGFSRSGDPFGDGSVVFVPLEGHTPGSLGMFLRTETGARYFFVGDVVWSAAAIAESRPKFALARGLVDDDTAATRGAIERIRAARERDPSLVVVPAHDGLVQRRLGYFPGWVR